MLFNQLYVNTWFAWYCIAGNFRGVQFSRKGNLQRFCGPIFADGRSRTAPPTIPGWLRLLPHVCPWAWTSRITCERLAIEKWHVSRYGPWLPHVQGNLVSCCWIRAILHERSGKLSRSVRSVRSHGDVKWGEGATKSWPADWSSSMQTTMATPPLNCAGELAYRFLFRGV